MNDLEIGKRIENIRKKEDMTRAQFANATGKTEDAIYNIERGRAKINPQFINLICNLFYINPNWILYGETPMYSPKSGKYIENITKNLEERENLLQLTETLLTLNDDQINILKTLIDVFSKAEGK